MSPQVGAPLDRSRRPAGLAGARIAVCHEWTLRRAGSEQVAAALVDMLQPDDIFTVTATPGAVGEVFGRPVWASAALSRPKVQARWDRMLPTLAGAWRTLDLSAYDLVVTSSHSCVNSVRVGPQTRMVSYCHTPMRYAWAWREELGRVPGPLRPAWPVAAAGLRRIDRAAADRVDRFVANSRFVASRIEAAYGRPASVVYPPVATDFYAPDDTVPREGHFLVAGRLVDYKRPDVAVAAAREAGVALVVAGDGPALSRLRAEAGPDTSFVTSPDDAALRTLYRQARALIFPGVEDFGITPVEAMACGTPVLTQSEGGAAESVVDGLSGRVLDDRSVAAFAEALASWPQRWPAADCRSRAERFSPRAFRDAMTEVLALAL